MISVDYAWRVDSGEIARLVSSFALPLLFVSHAHSQMCTRGRTGISSSDLFLVDFKRVTVLHVELKRHISTIRRPSRRALALTVSGLSVGFTR